MILNLDKDKSDNKSTAFTHGDINFEIQFMLAPQLEASIYLHGMYVIHLKDNWGEKKP